MKILTKAFFMTPFILSVFAPIAFAATPPSAKNIMLVKPAEVTAAPVVTIKEKSLYQLPYPGLLPDHPLYMLKALRDKILDALIVDPLRKAEFYILLGDKHASMGITASEKGKAQLAEEVISKGEKYMDKAVSGLMAFKTSGKEVPGYITDRLGKSLGKHIEVIEDLLAKADDAQKAGLTGSLDLAIKLQGDVGKLK